MSASSAPVSALRLLLLGMLLASFVLKPALAFAEEVHELVEHAAAGSHGHDHAFGEHAVDVDSHADDDRATTPDDGKNGHDDEHWHLTHCCGQQAAMLPRLQFDLPATASASPVATLSVAFAPTRLTAPFRPPIAV